MNDGVTIWTPRGEVEPGEWLKKKEPTLADLGIVNRRSARQAGLRNPKKPRAMAVPKAKR